AMLRSRTSFSLAPRYGHPNRERGVIMIAALKALRCLVVAKLLALVCLTASFAQQPAKPALPPINPAQARADQTLGGLDGPGFAIAYNEEAGILVAACERSTLQYWNKGET